VTNKREGYARELLQLAGIDGQMSFVYGGDTFRAKKPDPLQLNTAAERWSVAPAEAILVGDLHNDCEAAHRAGFGFVFAAYGYAAPDDPALTGGLAVIQTFADLHSLLCRS
jgi:phosphoglycolate phosphatase